MATGTTRVDWVERVAIGASAACLVHCLALPLLIAALPALSAVLDIPESFHLWALGLAIPAALFALLQGRSKHGDTGPLLLGLVGLTLMVLGALVVAETAETPVTVAGSLLLAGAHLINWRRRHACGC
ncbi:MerC domain-containing protein [Sphingomonas bacterium]|uniref:MerC domain-containing protein n=1 Tax=Sphingomonas bacterium TaxID=1895847 RepID=UPI001576D665|nr:MerC domain-containing protein [Sphingomonas bacterium]